MIRSLVFGASFAGAALVAAPSLLPAQTDSAVRRIAFDMVPNVERATGLRFKRPPRVNVRSRDQLRAYLEHRTRIEFPPAEQRAQERVFRAFGLVPDTLNLLQIQLDMLQEQIAGFFDPDSGALFVIRGGDALLLRAIISHELVHALQDQYMRLAPILEMRRQTDRQKAAHAVLEGQATLAGLMAMTPGMTTSQLAENWEALRGMVREQQENASGVLGTVPRIMRDGLIFPYIGGAEFMLAYEQRRSSPDEMPYGPNLPLTTEQILHPSKYTSHERGLSVSFAATPGDTVIYDDDFGEFYMKVALESWRVGEAEALASASGWNGDRYQVRGTRGGGTIVLWAAGFDTARDAQDFERVLRRVWERSRGTSQRGNRWTVEQRTIGGASFVVLTDAPNAWRGWTTAPAVTARRPS